MANLYRKAFIVTETRLSMSIQYLQKALNTLISSVLVFCFAVPPVFADGYSPDTSTADPQPTYDTSTPPSEASDASFDKRLPPVLAGEVVNDSGRMKRVWSTSGPVPVSDAPEPWKKNLTGQGNGAGIGVGNIGVIVDRNSRKSKRDDDE